MHRILHAAAGLGVALALIHPACAAVTESDAGGFAIQQTAHIAAPPDKVYAALIVPAKWWSSKHTFSGSAANLSIDAHGGGCFCEKLPNGGSVEHGEVVVAMPGAMLRLRGPLGPFQGEGVDGALTFTLKAGADGTDVTLDNVIGGHMRGGFADWPRRADAMLSDQMTRLKAYLETGTPETKP